jgi:hypothetical protein
MPLPGRLYQMVDIYIYIYIDLLRTGEVVGRAVKKF